MHNTTQKSQKNFFYNNFFRTWRGHHDVYTHHNPTWLFRAQKSLREIIEFPTKKALFSPKNPAAVTVIDCYGKTPKHTNNRRTTEKKFFFVSKSHSLQRVSTYENWLANELTSRQLWFYSSLVVFFGVCSTTADVVFFGKRGRGGELFFSEGGYVRQMLW